MSLEQLKQVLALVALEAASSAYANRCTPTEMEVRMVAEVLERRILPLLLAGQKMAELGSWNTSASVEVWEKALEAAATRESK